jgi:hypothetical protein
MGAQVMDRLKIAQALVDTARELVGGEFTEQQWKTHKKKHPDANKSDHTITKPGKGGPKKPFEHQRIEGPLTPEKQVGVAQKSSQASSSMAKGLEDAWGVSDEDQKAVLSKAAKTVNSLHRHLTGLSKAVKEADSQSLAGKVQSSLNRVISLKSKLSMVNEAYARGSDTRQQKFESVVEQAEEVAKHLKMVSNAVSSQKSSLREARMRVAWDKVAMHISGRGDFAKAKKIVRKHLGKQAADDGLMMAVFLFLEYREEPETVKAVQEELKRAGLKNVYVAPAQ